MPQTLFVTDGCLIDYEMPFVFRVTHLESARSAKFLVQLNVQFPNQPERLSAILVTQNPMQDQDGNFIEDDVATQMRSATLRSVKEQGLEVDLLLYNIEKEIYCPSRQSYLQGAEKEAFLRNLAFLDAVHRDERIQRKVKDKNSWPTHLTELSDFWDEIAWEHGRWRGIQWPSLPPEQWIIPARYRTTQQSPPVPTSGLDSVTRVATGMEIIARRGSKFMSFSSEYPMELRLAFYEYRSEPDPNTFSLYTRQQFGCRYTRCKASWGKRPLHESFEMYDPVPSEVRDWVEGTLRRALPEYLISIKWLNPDDKVPLFRVGNAGFQISGDGIFEAPWGWRIRIERSTGPDRVVTLECYDATRKTYLILPYDNDRGCPEIRVPSAWHNGELMTAEQYRYLKKFLDRECSEARVVREVDLESR